ncbi:MAG TPA: DUF4238 domain-containing protein, partial [Fimbriiglobus sp.]
MSGKMNQERHHHYVAAFQLAGFTVDGTKTGRLYVIDRKLAKEWQSSPIEAAKERDYNAVKAQPDQNVIERAFGKIESEAAVVIKEIVQTRQIPEGPSFDWFINYVALAAARVPWIRKIVESVTDRFLKDHFRQVFNKPGAFDKIRQEFAALGFKLDQNGFEEIKEHMFSDEVRMNLDQTTMVMTT